MPHPAHPLPPLPPLAPGLALVRRRGEPLARGDLIGEALGLAGGLPRASGLVNLCEDRGHFIAGLLAALVRGIPCLLPPSAAVPSIEESAAGCPGALCLCDRPIEGLSLPQWRVDERSAGCAGPGVLPAIDQGRECVLAFTSGSTGRPQANPKRWVHLLAGAVSAGRRFGIGPGSTLVVTVPAQHMYGLELSVLVPLAVGAAVDAGRPFFPEDVRLALARVPPPRVLVTTPVHLAACVERMDGGWPAVELVISATAPLSPELAGAVERRLGTRVCEIYGCTEAGSMASRRTLDGPRWRWYEGIGPRQLADGVAVSGEILAGEVRLADRLELHGDGSFSLLGRGADLVKVAGKRASLADLNLKLAAIEGVVEGVFVVPEGAGPESARLGAVAVAPGLDRETLLAALRQRLDPAFVPRPLVLVERLPRNATGKIPREALLALIAGRGGERS